LPVAATAAPIPASPREAVSSGARNRVYVSPLDTEVDEKVLHTYFTYFGTLLDVYIPVDKATGCKKRLAFVTMSCAEEVAHQPR